MREVTHLLLDLGGVLYGVDYKRTLERLGLAPHDLPTLLQEPTLMAYEKGEISTHEFLDSWQKHFPHLSQTALQEAWNAMLLGPLSQAESILQTLSAHYPIALLSNTNDLHLTIVEPQIIHWRPYFVEAFFSNRLGKRKPDPETYLFVLEKLAWPAENTLFVDDNLSNIHGAQAAGLRTYLLPANQPQQLIAALSLMAS